MDGELVCGRQVFVSVSLNLVLDKDNVFVVPSVDGIDSAFHINCLGDG